MSLRLSQPFAAIARALEEWSICGGLTLFVASLFLYESDSRVIFGRWSYAFASMLAIAVGVWVGVLVAALRTLRPSQTERRINSLPRRSFGFATLLWGAAYLLSALEDNANAGRFLNLNFFGSVSPPAALLEWLAITGFAIATATWLASRIPIRWQSAAVSAGTLLAVAVIGEGVARVVTVVSPAVMGFPSYSQALWHRRHTTTNSLGFRDIERTLLPATGTSRAIVVGDSFTYGTGIDNVADRFSEQLADRLNTRGTGKWEVLNAGREDTHTLQHLAALPRLLEFNPELVILLYVFNDINYLTPQTARSPRVGMDGLLGTIRPSRVLFLNSYLYQEIFVRWRLVRLSFRTATASAYADDALVQKHFADLDRFVRTVVDGGASALIVPFNPGAAHYEQYRARYRKFVQGAREFGLPLCDLEYAFDGYAFALLRINALDSHPTALANRLAVDRTLNCLEETPPTRLPDELDSRQNPASAPG